MLGALMSRASAERQTPPSLALARPPSPPLSLSSLTPSFAQLYANSQNSTDAAPADLRALPHGEVSIAERQPAHSKLTVQAPGFDDYDDSESENEDDERPLTRDELTRKTNRNYRPGKGDKDKKGKK